MAAGQLIAKKVDEKIVLDLAKETKVQATQDFDLNLAGQLFWAVFCLFYGTYEDGF